MQKKNKFNGLSVVLMIFFISACVSNKPSIEPLSREKEADLYLQMGVRYLEMNMLKEAKEKLEEAVRTDSGNAKTHNILGVLHERLREFDLAAKSYQKAIKINSTDASIKNNYGRFLCERGDYQKGMALLKEALRLPLNNRSWFAYTNIGRCELLQGDPQLAEGNFRQALLANKNYSPALLEMQKISYRSGKFMSARAFLQRYLAVAQHNSSTLWYAMKTEMALGNQPLAKKYKTELFSLFPASKEAQQLKEANQ